MVEQQTRAQCCFCVLAPHAPKGAPRRAVLGARDPSARLDVQYKLVGPVAAFTAWNFPALAAGYPIILKPSEETPSRAFLFAEEAKRAGLPDGVLSVVAGDPTEIPRHLIASPVIRKVSLTGSVPVGKLIMKLCGEGLKRLSLELGGHAPVLVFPDADPVAAGKACAAAKFRNSGQVCISPSRFYVHASIKDAFAAAMAESARSLKQGSGVDPSVTVGPIINARGRERVETLVQDAIQRGARSLAGGSRPSAFNRGYFFEPRVLDNVPDDARVMREEPFGPVAPFEDYDEVIARANGTPFGLAGYVFTSSVALANRPSSALKVGMVGVNELSERLVDALLGVSDDGSLDGDFSAVGARSLVIEVVVDLDELIRQDVADLVDQVVNQTVEVLFELGEQGAGAGVTLDGR